MFRTKVLVGQYTEGNPDLRRPPEIPGQVHKFYDSCVNKDKDPQIFVVFDRKSALSSIPNYVQRNNVSSESNPCCSETYFYNAKFLEVVGW